MPTDASSARKHPDALLRVRALGKQYWARRGTFRRRVPLTAARNVTFEIPGGKTLAIVGSSGSGKSTVARCVARLEKPDSGEIRVESTDIAQLGHRELLPFR